MLAKSTDEVVYVIAKYDYNAAGHQELSLKKNEKLRLMDDSMHWWKVLNSKNQQGFVPSNFVKKEKPSLFDSFRRKVKKLSEAKTKDDNSPLASPVPRTVDIDINSVSDKQDEFKKNGFSDTPTKKQNSSSQHFAIAKYSYEAQQSDELSLTKGDKIVVLEKSADGWWKGELGNEKIGWFPSNYVIEETVESFNQQQKNGSSDHHNNNSKSINGQETNGKKIDDAPTLPLQFEPVVALYSFKCQNEEELSFEKGEQLEVIDKPACDPDWWTVKNKHGETGLAPKSYLQTLTNEEKQQLERIKYDSLKDSELTNKTWYYGAISRVQCDQLLNEFGKLGDFLVRDSETNAGDYSVSLKALGRNKHFRVHFEDNVYCIGQRKFVSLDELIEHYKVAPIHTGPEGDKLYLIKPFLRP